MMDPPRRQRRLNDNLDVENYDAAINLFDGAVLKPLKAASLNSLLCCWLLPHVVTLSTTSPISTLRAAIGDDAFEAVCASGGIRGLLAHLNMVRTNLRPLRKAKQHQPRPIVAVSSSTSCFSSSSSSSSLSAASVSGSSTSSC